MTLDDHPVDPAAGPRPLRVAAGLRAEVVGESVLVVGEDGVTSVRGRAAVEVLRLIDGVRDVDAVERDAPRWLTAGEVRAVVDRLAGAGLLESGPTDRGGRADFFRAAGVRGVTTSPALTVGIVDLGDPVAAVTVAGALDESGFAVTRTDATSVEVMEGSGAGPRSAMVEADACVVVVTDHLDPRLGELDERFRRSGTAWLPMRTRGVRGWIGPFVGAAPEGPCWHCLAARSWGHRRAEEAFQVERGRSGPLERDLPAHPAAIGAIAYAVALEVDAWAHGLERPVTRGVKVHDHRAATSTMHALRRRPQCPGCGDPDLVARQGRVPPPRDGRSSAERRGVRLSEAYHHLVSPVTGVVPALEDVPSPVAGVHLARTGPTPPARSLPLQTVRTWTRCGNGGSGDSAEEARMSALGEALERWSGQFHGDEPRCRVRRAELGEEAVDPRDVLLVHPRQSDKHHTWNAAHGPFNQIGPEVDDQEETDWTPLWSLRDGTRRFLPTAMLYHGAPGPAWAFADSNGCAAGPTRQEAVRRGLLELVERDAVALWWYHRSRVPGVPVDGPSRDAHGLIGRDVWALDLTTDLGIPVVAALSARAGAGDRVMLGAAADPDPSSALARALRELAAGTGAVLDGAPVPTDPDARRWFAEVDLIGEPWLRPRGSSVPEPVAADLGAIVARLAGHGLEALVLDQTRPDVGLPVVRAVVPGLRPMWARFAPGRLFDVPAALGREPRAARYEDLNPRAVFL